MKRRRIAGAGPYAKIEKKFHDLDINITSMGATGEAFVSNGPNASTQTIVDIAQNTTESGRIGRKCTITNVHLRMNFEFIVASSTNSMAQARNAHETVRIIIYWDKQCNGVPATASDLLEGTTPVYNNYRNLANVKRFVFLHDKIYAWNASAMAAGGDTVTPSERIIKDYQINISLKMFIPIEYSGTSGNISEIRSNNVGILVWTKHGDRMAASPSKVRVRYIDY